MASPPRSTTFCAIAFLVQRHIDTRRTAAYPPIPLTNRDLTTTAVADVDLCAFVSLLRPCSISHRTESASASSTTAIAAASSWPDRAIRHGSASGAPVLCSSPCAGRSSANSPWPTIGHRGAPSASHLRVSRTW